MAAGECELYKRWNQHKMIKVRAQADVWCSVYYTNVDHNFFNETNLKLHHCSFVIVLLPKSEGNYEKTKAYAVHLMK